VGSGPFVVAVRRGDAEAATGRTGPQGAAAAPYHGLARAPIATPHTASPHRDTPGLHAMQTCGRLSGFNTPPAARVSDLRSQRITFQAVHSPGALRASWSWAAESRTGAPGSPPDLRTATHRTAGRRRRADRVRARADDGRA